MKLGSSQAEKLLQKGKRKQLSLVQKPEAKRTRSDHSSENLVMVHNVCVCIPHLSINKINFIPLAEGLSHGPSSSKLPAHIYCEKNWLF